MAPPRPPRVRDCQRGNTLLIALIVMSALAALGSLTVVGVQSSLKTSTNDRSQAIAVYAAESGAAVAMDFLRNNFNLATGWSSYVTPSNGGVVMTAIPGNDLPPEDPSSLFSAEQNAWFDIRLLNNRGDPNYAAAFGTNDQDGQIIIRATGHGPQGSLAVIEAEVRRLPACPPAPAVPDPLQPPPCGPPVPPGWGALPAAQPLILVSWHVVSL